MVGCKAKVNWTSIGRDRINSSIDLTLSLCANSSCKVVLTSSHGRRAENVRIFPICLNSVRVLPQAWMFCVFCLMYTLPQLMALVAAAKVLMELISKNASEGINAICCVGCNRIQLVAI